MNNTFSFQQIAAPKVLSAEVREAISNNVLQFYVRDQQQDTQDEGITALYERLSQEDKLEGESNSIANQKKILERYCREHGITAYRHYDEDDGYSGTNFNRPGFQRMLADIKAGKIKRVIVKDMSRFGRDYLQVGFYTDMLFPDFGVHFIAVNDGVDSTRGENEFTAIRNVFNEMYARDTSKKIRATWQSKGRHFQEDTRYLAIKGDIRRTPYHNPALWLCERPGQQKEVDYRRGSRSRCAADFRVVRFRLGADANMPLVREKTSPQSYFLLAVKGYESRQ